MSQKPQIILKIFKKIFVSPQKIFNLWKSLHKLWKKILVASKKTLKAFKIFSNLPINSGSSNKISKIRKKKFIKAVF